MCVLVGGEAGGGGKRAVVGMLLYSSNSLICSTNQLTQTAKHEVGSRVDVVCRTYYIIIVQSAPGSCLLFSSSFFLSVSRIGQE